MTNHSLRCTKSARQGPALLDPPQQQAGVKVQLARPLPQILRASVERDGAIYARVVRLCDAIRPSTVGRFVMAVVVDAIQRVFRSGTWPHIGVERGERVPPSFAHCNSATAVIMKSGIARITAALFHGRPDVVFRRNAQAMRAFARAIACTTKTATAFGSSAQQPIADDDGFVPTYATATEGVIATSFSCCHHRQSCVGVPDQFGAVHV